MEEIPSTIVHFYRASVMHADVWRQRLDATTNWAVVSTAAILTFAFSAPENPHFILLLALTFDTFFLIMESRRYQMFDLYRHRVRMLNRYVIAPALSPTTAPDPNKIATELTALATELGSTVPHLSLIDSMGYRLRRNYGLLFGAVFATWLLKLWYHPNPAHSAPAYIERAQIGIMPGAAVLTGAAVLIVVLIFLAVRARTERMEEWRELPSPLRRAFGRARDEEREMSLASEEGLRAFEGKSLSLGDVIATRRREHPTPPDGEKPGAGGVDPGE